MKKIALRQLHRKLTDAGYSLAVAESCTGGLLSKFLTDLSGSSAYFIFGIVAYNNNAKIKLLNIPRHLIKNKGAVSKEVAQQMARNVKEILDTDIGVGITGIAGPTGGSKLKPKGTVFISLAKENHSITKRFIFKGNRLQIRNKSCAMALSMLDKLI
ncbi:MAG: CinA family protein [Candidatus Omnitrophota bacterium]|jgi:PncC family amidohydrolase|nr:MAG: CinA family protein [Candidatus Omnitrophota bacterium]